MKEKVIIPILFIFIGLIGTIGHGINLISEIVLNTRMDKAQSASAWWLIIESLIFIYGFIKIIRYKKE